MFRENPPFLLATLLLCSLTLNSTFAQRNCQTMENLQLKSISDSDLYRRMQKIERHTSNYLPIVDFRNDQKVIIPVVVHIVHANEAENLPLELIKSQIDVLNEDFNRRNEDRNDIWPQAANVDIEFRLAELDPDGNPTDGIVRKQTSGPYFSLKDRVKYNSYGGSDAWPTTDYLNIWVCNLFGRQMGFAQLPGGGPAGSDGVVIDYAYFGRRAEGGKYDLGRTCTHEVGHWLNLRHIWGDGDCKKDDYVSDTPSASYPTFGCQTNKNSCAGGDRDMIENFMDYTNDPCMNLFTEGQKARMHTLFMPGGFRASILNSSGIKRNDDSPEPPGESEEEANQEEETSTEESSGEGNTAPNSEVPTNSSGCAAPHNLSASVSGNGLIATWSGNSERYTFQIKLPNMNQWFGFTTTKKDIRISGLSKGIDYKARIKSVCANDSESPWVNFTLSLDRFSDLSVKTEDLNLYPNPASKQVSVEWKIPDIRISNSNKPSFLLEKVLPAQQLALYGIRGNLVLRKHLDVAEKSCQIDVSNMLPGMYFIVLLDEKGYSIRRKKLVVN